MSTTRELPNYLSPDILASLTANTNTRVNAIDPDEERKRNITVGGAVVTIASALFIANIIYGDPDPQKPHLYEPQEITHHFQAHANKPYKAEQIAIKKAAPVQTDEQPVHHVRTNTTGAETYEFNGHRYTISPEVHRALKNVEAKHDVPYMGLIPIAIRESGGRADAINPKSGACGLFQFMTNKTETLYEVMYKFGNPNIKSLVEQYVSGHDKQGRNILGYHPVNDNARKEALRHCLNPEFNATMWAEYNDDKIDEYNDWLGDKKISGGGLVGLNNLGLGGLKALAKQAWDDKANHKTTMAADFYEQNKKLYGGSMKANATLIYHKDGSLKTVRESYAELFKYGSYGELKKVDPDSGETTLANLALENN
ncbi:MAG: transglycosylase SLT domain-containing protein [Alphaproteobacteria bacterium]